MHMPVKQRVRHGQEFSSPDELSIIDATQQLAIPDQNQLTQAQIDAAQYPMLYIDAREALVACVEVDEVKVIDDKFTALAMYAKQARNKDLEILAQRITLRAERRMGELFEEMREGGKKGTGPFSAAAEHGISKEVTVRAVKLARAPAEAFEEKLNTGNVSNKTKFAKELDTDPQPPRAARKQTPLQHRKEVLGAFQDFRQFWERYNEVYTQQAFSLPDAKSAALSLVEKIERRLSSFRANPKAHNAALDCVDAIRDELSEYFNRPVDKKSPESVIDYIEANVRVFKRVVKAIR
jgi:hypothetical protein